MYKNIVFDLGGVVIDYSPKDFLVDKFFSSRVENELFNAVFGSEEWQMLDRGEMTWAEAQKIFLQRGKELDLAFEMQAVMDEWTEMLQTRKATVTMMRLLKKKGFELYYLSNVSREIFEMLSQRDFWKLFDGGIASYEIGATKPDLAIYQAFLKKCNLVPQETIFTDDKKENAGMAFQAGITGIQFKNVKNFCKMLITYGIEIY